MSADPRYRLKPYHVLDGTLVLEAPGGRYQLTAFVRNLTDSYYWNAVHLQGDSFARFAAMPRTWGMALTRSF